VYQHLPLDDALSAPVFMKKKVGKFMNVPNFSG
jgi:hypothetical protein